MKVLVTGAAGHLGRALQLQILKRRDIEPSYAMSRRRDTSRGGIPMDLADADSINRLVLRTQPEAIVHLGSIVGAACETDAAMTQRVNVDAVESLANAAADLGTCRIILASTAALYGDRFTKPISEDGEIQPASSYATSKYEAEQRLMAIANSRAGISGIALRIFNVYGAGFDGSLANRLLSSTAESPVALVGLDSFVRDYVRAEDVASAIISSLDVATKSPFTPYNIGSGEAVSNRLLVERLGQRQEIHYRVIDGSASYSCANINKAKIDLGFDPLPIGS